MKPLDIAIQELIALAQMPARTEVLPLAQAFDRVLAADVVATMDVPSFDNSAMDGYALVAPDGFDANTVFKVVQRIRAGDAAEAGSILQAGQAARIFTGAPIPQGTTQVVMQEQCAVDGVNLTTQATCAQGQHMRRRAEDVATGSVLLRKGEWVTPASASLIASMGLAQVEVKARLRVALITTGSELVELGVPLQSGQIYNSNRYALLGLLRNWGCDVVLDAHVVDDLAVTTELLSRAAQSSDLIVTVGGASVGEEDYVKAAIATLGEIHGWQVAMKPGKPLIYGRVASTPLMGLPGNPVSSFVTACLCLRPYIRARLGALKLEAQYLNVTADFEWRKPDMKRVEFVRAVMNNGVVQLSGAQGSAVMTGLARAEVLVRLEAGQSVARGDEVRVVLMAELTGL